jgi:hypothetical protein
MAVNRKPDDWRRQRLTNRHPVCLPCRVVLPAKGLRLRRRPEALDAQLVELSVDGATVSIPVTGHQTRSNPKGAIEIEIEGYRGRARIRSVRRITGEVRESPDPVGGQYLLLGLELASMSPDLRERLFAEIEEQRGGGASLQARWETAT